MAEYDDKEVSNESWMDRISGAFKGIIFGLILFIVSFPLLFWNEGRSVKTYTTLKEGERTVISVPAERVDPGNSAKPVHVTGKAVTNDTLSDPVFGVSVQALKLNRDVVMFQWEEKAEKKTEKKAGGGTETVTTHSYNKIWSDKLIGSSNFKKAEDHRNPDALPYESVSWVADSVTIGAFRLPSSMVRQIDDFTPVAIHAGTRIPADIKGRGIIHNAGFYIGKDPATPRIGDMRVSFKAVNPTDVSIIAKQVKNTFEPYQTKAGGTIELVQTGIQTPDTMIKTARQSNAALTWLLRLAGFLCMFIGLALILSPLSVIADVLPILGDIMAAGTWLMSFLIAAVLSLITIAIAWIVYRPLLAAALIVAAVGSTFAVLRKLKKI